MMSAVTAADEGWSKSVGGLKGCCGDELSRERQRRGSQRAVMEGKL